MTNIFSGKDWDYMKAAKGDAEVQRRAEELAEANGTRMPTAAEVVKAYSKTLHQIGLWPQDVIMVAVLAAEVTRQIIAKNDSKDEGEGVTESNPSDLEVTLG